MSKALFAQVNHADKQIEWIRSYGGFFSPKIAFQLLDKDDPNSPMGIFALEDLYQKEALMVIPQSCLLTSGGSLETCDTARNLIKQRQLKNESKFAPYVDYVFDPKHKGQIPSSWSQAGESLIQRIIGEEMPPYDVAGISFKEECGGSGDPLEEEAYLNVVRRSWDDIMVPVFDMINHRNGHWYNVDSNSAHDGTDITVFASRDVKAGEQLYLSYNECADCDYALTYVLPHILKDYGFVEQYPRRWRFDTKQRALVFELDQDPVTNELQLTWLSKKPTKYQIKFLQGQLNRLKDLEDYVTEQASHLDSSHEQYVSLEYYEALKTALEYALLTADEENGQQECAVDSETCVAQEYDELDTVTEEMEFNYDVCDFQRIRDELYDPFYESSDSLESFYQKIQFEYSEQKSDTCLYMNGHLHACASFRPHYHEVFVHYPARFVNEVKRVAFVGGGDNMIVHEILKYSSLELVVGLELDQQVVRSSFKNFGTQPYFDDERLQWWFGDGSKSLLLLPEEYYGTFDVVYIDLQNDVMDILKVTDELDFMDAAMLLLKPDGVIARNEDWDFGTADPFTDYTVDLFYVDVPIICHQGITMGSKTVDFLTQTPKDHGVDTIYLKPASELNDRFDIWYNYRKSSGNHTDKLCVEAGSKGKKLLTEELKRTLGILVVIEAEDIAMPLDSPSSVQASLSNALKNSGLTETSVRISESNEERYEIVFIIREGYLVSRTWPNHKYCAFDLMLWSSTEKQEEAKAQIVKAVRSKSVSSYRIIMGGMFGASDVESHVGPSVSESCDEGAVDILVQDTQAEPSDINTILTASISLFQDRNASVLVLCGEMSTPCNSLDVLDEKLPAMKVTPIWVCPSLELEGDALQPMNGCESDTRRHLEELDYKIGGIVIDAKAPRVMGRILHKILSGNKVRRKLLTDKHVVLSISPSDGSIWRRALLDRFRTDFARFDPAYRAEILLSNLELEVFSSGDSSFYSHLMKVASTIKDKTGISPHIPTIKNGVNNYVADFEPTKIFSHHDYDLSASLQQWSSQQPLSEQSVFQFKMDKESKSYPLSAKSIKEALQNALFKMANTSEHLYLDVQLYESVGDGCLIVSFWSTGSAILTWDGKEYISVNLLSNQSHEKFIKAFQQKSPLTITSWDEMPRGIGKVVNFQEDLGSRDEAPHWA